MFPALGLYTMVGLLYGAGAMEAWRTAAWVWLVPVGLGALAGFLSAVVELRSWGWQALAGVEARQVLWGGRALRWTSLAVALAAFGTILVLTVPRAFAEWRHRAAAGALTADTAGRSCRTSSPGWRRRRKPHRKEISQVFWIPSIPMRRRTEWSNDTGSRTCNSGSRRTHGAG